MPNHVHCILYFPEAGFNLNKILSNGERFMAYELIDRLEKANDIILLKDEKSKAIHVLSQLREAVNSSDKDKGKIHQVFERSFDCKEITHQHFYLQKLSYIHNNPCRGV